MKYARPLIGLVVVLVAVWVIVGEQMSGASADAVVNAPVVTVRADVAGTLELPDRAYGSRVTSGEVVANITDQLVDTVRLNDLVLESKLAAAETIRLNADLKAARDLQAELLQRGRVFNGERLAELRSRLTHARFRLAYLETGEMPDDTELRIIDLIDGAQDKQPGEPVDSPLVLSQAREQVEILEIALRAAERGVFLGDGYNDSPNSVQRATELESVISELESALQAAEAREKAINERVGRERVRVNALTGGEITAPMNGLFWDVLQADGVTVQRGDPILRLIDCDATIVTLSVTERIYNTLRVGQSATFRLSGSSDPMDGTIARLAGSGAATVYENLAIAPSPRHLERYDVALLVPALSANPETRCMIGQTGRAFFDRRPLDWFRG